MKEHRIRLNYGIMIYEIVRSNVISLVQRAHYQTEAERKLGLGKEPIDLMQK